MAVAVNKRFSFGEFELDAERRLLMREGKVVPLKAKTFDLLVVLVENAGEVITKEQLLDRVWENQFVEENNLTVHIAALRKALGERRDEHRFIVTVPGKGYRFVSNVTLPSNGDVVFERRTLERIVVDQYEETDDKRLLSWAPGRRAPIIAVCALAVAGIVTAWFGYSYWKTPAESASQPVIKTFATSGIPQRVAVSNDGKLLAYVRRLKGKDSIWIGDLQTNSNIQITPETNRLHTAIAFSPDARTIYFTARDENHPEYTLMSVPTLGGAVRDLVPRVEEMTFSPDGREIAYLKRDAATRRIGLYVADAFNVQNERPAFIPEPPARIAEQSLSWSPRERAITIALTDEHGKGCDLVNISPDEGSMNRFGKDQCQGGGSFEWLKDGSGIAITTRGMDDQRSQIWVIDFPGGERRPATNDATTYGSFSLSTAANGLLVALAVRNYPSIWTMELKEGARPERLLHGSGRGEGAYGMALAPDSKLIYTIRAEGSRGIWEMSLDGSGQREIVPAGGKLENVQVNVTPDNSHLVFESNRNGSSEIWRSNRDGSAAVALTTGGDNQAPALAPDGRTVLYMSKRNGLHNIWSIETAGGTPRQLTEAGCTWPDVSPSGEQFLCITGTAADSSLRKLMIYDIAGGPSKLSFDIPVTAIPYNRPRWSPDGKSIIYKDVVDGLWQQSITGGNPQKLSGFEDERVFHFTFSRDGGLIYSGGVQMRQIVLIDKFR